MVRVQMGQIPEEEHKELLRLAETYKCCNFQNRLSFTEMLRRIAKRELHIIEPLSPGLIDSLLRGIEALQEKGLATEGDLILDWLQAAGVEVSQQEIKRNENYLLLKELISKRQPFQVTSRHTYSVMWADFWVAPEGEHRLYLRGWCKEADSRNHSSLAHNRHWRLDSIKKVEPIESPRNWRGEGLDYTKVKLFFNEQFTYHPKQEDESIENLEDGMMVTKNVWSDFWLLQTVGRYGGKCLIDEPEWLREKDFEQARMKVETYQTLE